MFRLAACFLFLLLALAAAGCHQNRKMTPARFEELADTPGDNVPLAALLTNGSPWWSNSIADVTMTYANGNVTSEEFPVKSKTIGGKYIVYSFWSKYYNQEGYSILAADEEAGTLTVYALYGHTLVAADLVNDPESKTYTEHSAYGDGYEELTTGRYSDTEDVSRTKIYKNGVLFMTRDATNRPAASN